MVDVGRVLQDWDLDPSPRRVCPGTATGQRVHVIIRRLLIGWRGWTPRTRDAVGVFFLLLLSFPLPGDSGLAAGATATAVAAVPHLALVYRRRFSMTVGAITAVSAFGAAAADFDHSEVASMMAVYTLGAYLPLRRGAPVGLAVIGVLVARILVSDVDYPWIVSGIVGLVPLGIGLIVYQSRTSRVDELEAEKFDAEQRVVDLQVAERRRLTRELHDVVSHALGVMVIQANVADEQLNPDPAASRQAIQAIRKTGMDALTDVRRMLTVLRLDDPSHDGRSEPQPTAAEIPELLIRFEELGLRIVADIDPGLATTSAGVQLCVYRLLQEALTNTVRHANANTVEISVKLYGSQINVEIRDDGQGAASTPTLGHGLTGMRERVAIFDGVISFDSRPGHGFEIRASLPTARGRQAERDADNRKEPT